MNEEFKNESHLALLSLNLKSAISSFSPWLLIPKSVENIKKGYWMDEQNRTIIIITDEHRKYMSNAIEDKPQIIWRIINAINPNGFNNIFGIDTV